MSASEPSTANDQGVAAFPFLATMLGRSWRVIRYATYTALFVAAGVITLEGIHLHELLSSIHPYLAWAVSAFLAAMAITVIGWATWRWIKLPRVVLPPDLPPAIDGWSRSQRRAYLAFCRRYLARQESNPELPEEARDRLPTLRGAIDDAEQCADPTELVRMVEAAIDEALEPLDRRARNLVWRAATEVAVLTAMTPSALFDVLITLLRNIELMVRIAQLYYSRPGALGTLRIVRDVLAVAAAAGVIERVADGATDMAADLMGNWTAKLAGPIGQGIANGLITVRLGDAAVHRCRALRTRRVGIKPWSAATWREMSRRLAGMVSKKVAPDLARRFGAAVDAAGGGAVRRGAGLLRRLFGTGEGSQTPS